MNREFYNFLKIYHFYVVIHAVKPHGMMKYWNVGIPGIEKGLRHLLFFAIYSQQLYARSLIFHNRLACLNQRHQVS